MNRPLIWLFLVLLMAVLAASCVKRTDPDRLDATYNGVVTPITEPVDLTYGPGQGSWTSETITTIGDSQTSEGSQVAGLIVEEGRQLVRTTDVVKKWGDGNTISFTDASLLHIKVGMDPKGNINTIDVQSPYFASRGVDITKSDDYEETVEEYVESMAPLPAGPVKTGDILFQEDVSRAYPNIKFKGNSVIEQSIAGYTQYNDKKCLLTLIDHGRIKGTYKKDNVDIIIEYISGYALYDARNMSKIKSRVALRLRIPEKGLVGTIHTSETREE